MKRAVFTLSLAAVALAPAGAAASASLVVYHLPDDVQTDIAVAPAQLRSMSGVTRHAVYDPRTIAAVRSALRRAQPVPAGAHAHSLDSRWSLVFNGGAGIKHIVCDRFGREGEVDGRRVHFRSAALIHVLQRSFS